MYFTPTYQNPTGATMPASTRQRVAAMADEFGIPAIEDHTLSELTVEGSPPGPIAKHSKAGMVLSVGSISKLFWAALRVGWVRAPVPVIAQLVRVKTGADLGSALMTQAIAFSVAHGIPPGKKEAPSHGIVLHDTTSSCRCFARYCPNRSLTSRMADCFRQARSQSEP